MSFHNIAMALKPILLAGVVAYAIDQLRRCVEEYSEVASMRQLEIAERISVLDSLKENADILTSSINLKVAQLDQLDAMISERSATEDPEILQPVAGSGYEFRFEEDGEDES